MDETTTNIGMSVNDQRGEERVIGHLSRSGLIPSVLLSTENTFPRLDRTELKASEQNPLPCFLLQ